jgi:hypothetical protein
MNEPESADRTSSPPESHRALESAGERVLMQERRWAERNARGVLWGVVMSVAGFWLPAAVVMAVVAGRR